MMKAIEQDDEQVPLLKAADHIAPDQRTNTINRRKMNIDDNPETPPELATSNGSRQRSSRPLVSLIFKHVTNINYVCSLAITIFFIYLCFSAEWVFFTWHPLLFTIGWMCIMTQGVLILSKNNFLADRISHTWRVRCHWIMQSVAICCIVSAFTIAVVSKNAKNKQHWKSWHGLMGLVSVIFALCPTLITSLPSLYHKELRAYITSKSNQLIHSIFGMASLVFGTITLILSLYSFWFERRTGGNLAAFTICWIVLFLQLVWVLFTPLTKAYDRIKNLIENL